MLRKLRPGEAPTGPAWKEVADYNNDLSENFTINEYFAARPEMMLGRMRLSGRMYRDNEPTLESDKRDLGEALAQAVEKLPQNIYEPQAHQVAEPTFDQTVPAPDYVKPNAYCTHDGMVCIREENVLRPLNDLPSEARSRIRGLIQVRDAVRSCLRSQLDGSSEEQVAEARFQLNLSYDRFSSRFGPVTLRANQRAFDGDPDLPLLLSLEDYDDETKTAKKATIFRERTIHDRKPVESVSEPKEALLVSLNERGRVDLDHMAALRRSRRAVEDQPRRSEQRQHAQDHVGRTKSGVGSPVDDSRGEGRAARQGQSGRRKHSSHLAGNHGGAFRPNGFL